MIKRPPQEYPDPIAQGLLARFSTAAWRLTMLALQALTIGFGLLLLWDGKNMVNSAIAKSPDVMAAAADLQKIHADLGALKETGSEVKVAADAAMEKAATATDKQDRIYDVLKSMQADSAAMKLTFSTGLATITERVDDVKSQLSRVEAKQDERPQ